MPPSAPTRPLVFGRVPHPPFADRPIAKPGGHGQDDLGPRQPKGVVYHRMIGTLRGTDGHFRNPATGALTDYGVGTVGTDGAADDGVTIRWNDPEGRQSGWASGPWENPPGDGRAYVGKFGVNAINRDLVSIEISGRRYEDPVSEAAIEAVAAISAHWADRCRVPWEGYPLNPHTGVVFTYAHNEFQGHKPCPGAVVMELIPEFIERTKAILRRYQLEEEGAVPEPGPGPEPEPPSPNPGRELPRPPAAAYPPGLDAGLAGVLFGSVTREGRVYRFDEGGAVSRLWLAEGSRSGVFPRLVGVERFEDGPGAARTYFTFANGLVVWRPNDGAAVRVMRGA